MKTRAAAAIVLFVLALAAVAGIYQWFFCRFYVPPEHMAIVTAKNGTPRNDGSILVERGEKGIWREVLPEGRYFLNPIFFDVRITPALDIPIGKVGIVTSKVGAPLPPGDIIAANKDSQGVWRNVLGPGLHRLNPEGYQVDIVDAINIPIGYVGVVTSQTGPAAPVGQFASIGEKGVIKDILQPGLYYVNPRAYQVNVIEIGMNQVSMTGKQGSLIEVKNQIASTNVAVQEMQAQTLSVQQQRREDYRKKSTPQRPAAAREDETVIFGISNYVEFPSRDGFKIMMDMTVEFELLPGDLSRIYLVFGDLPKVVEKILLPQILSISRIKGSSYKAQDFIVGDGRETFQNNLRSDLVEAMKEKNIIIHNAIIRNVAIPENILKPIQEASIAVEQNLTNESLQEAAKMEGELNTQTALIEQKRREVEQQTKLQVAEIAANERQAVRMVEVNTELEVANIELESAQIIAKSNQLRGETEVKAQFLRENETALGTQMKAESLGAMGMMADLMLVENLNPQLSINIIHAGDGTLWTDLKNAALTINPNTGGKAPTKAAAPRAGTPQATPRRVGATPVVPPSPAPAVPPGGNQP